MTGASAARRGLAPRGTPRRSPSRPRCRRSRSRRWSPSIAVGEFPVPPLDVARLARRRGRPGGRLHRARPAAAARADRAARRARRSALAGAMFQQVTRNALVSPDIVGVSGGASLAAVAVIVLRLVGARSGAARRARRRARRAAPRSTRSPGAAGCRASGFVLVGIGVAALAQAGVGYVLTEGRIFEVAAGVRLARRLGQRPRLGAGVAARRRARACWRRRSARSARRADALELGDDLARALGRGRRALAAGAARRRRRCSPASPWRPPARSASSPSSPAPRPPPRAARPRCRALLPLAAGCGAALVLACDLAGRAAVRARPRSRSGCITSIVAAPYFLLLLRRASVWGRRMTAPLQRARLSVAYDRRRRRSTGSTSRSRASGSPRSSAPTAAASRRCCARSRG